MSKCYIFECNNAANGLCDEHINLRRSTRSPGCSKIDCGKLRSAAAKAHDALLMRHEHSGHPDHPAEIALHLLTDALKEI